MVDCSPHLEVAFNNKNNNNNINKKYLFLYHPLTDSKCASGVHTWSTSCILFECRLYTVVILVGFGDILLDDVECVGTESAIADCPHAGWGVSNCAHSEDVGVICMLNEGTTIGSPVLSISFDPIEYVSNSTPISLNPINSIQIFNGIPFYLGVHYSLLKPQCPTTKNTRALAQMPFVKKL